MFITSNNQTPKFVVTKNKIAPNKAPQILNDKVETKNLEINQLIQRFPK